MTAPPSARWTGAAAAGREALGADPVPDGVRFGVWAPRASTVEVVIEGEPERMHPLRAGTSGYHSTVVPGVAAGERYRFRLDGEHAYPDPVRASSPTGRTVRPSSSTHGIPLVGRAPGTGVALPGQVIYELHVGTFTPEGTFDAAIRELPGAARARRHAARADAGGRVPRPLQLGLRRRRAVRAVPRLRRPGRLQALRRRRARVGLGVILDVVYNHFGPDGNYLREFSADYFTDRYDNEWGDAINFDGPHAAPVREFFVENAALLDPRVPPRRPAARRDPARSTTRAARTSSPSSSAAAAPRRGGRARSCSSPRTSRSTPRARAARRTAATASTRCGTTTSTTRAGSR